MIDNKYAVETTAQDGPPLERDEPSHNQPASVSEMEIDLGYAEASTEEHVIDYEVMEPIQTLSLNDRVGDKPLLGASILENDNLNDSIVTLSEVVGDLPLSNQQPLTEAKNQSEPSTEHSELADQQKTEATQQTLKQKTDNPFLPQHILDKLSQGRKDLADDIVQSSAALDVSTALLRTHARAERRPSNSNLKAHNTNPFASKDNISKQKQELVNDLVDEYLPLVAAELRRRLHKLLDK